VLLVRFDADRAAAGLPGRVERAAGSGERVDDETAGRAGVADQRVEDAERLLRRVDSAFPHVWGLYDGLHEPRTVICPHGRAASPSPRGLLRALADNSLVFAVVSGPLGLVVDAAPRAPVPVRGNLVATAEPVSRGASGDLLPPHHVLAELPVGGGKFVAAVEEHSHAAEAPHRAGRVGGVLGPALRPAVPGEACLGVGRIRDDAVRLQPEGGQDVPHVAEVQLQAGVCVFPVGGHGCLLSGRVGSAAGPGVIPARRGRRRSRGGGGQRVVVRAVVPALHVRPAVLGESGSVSGGLLGGWGGLEVRGDRVGGGEVVAGAGDLVGGDGRGGCSFGVVCACLWVTGQGCSGRAVVITGSGQAVLGVVCGGLRVS